MVGRLVDYLKSARTLAQRWYPPVRRFHCARKVSDGERAESVGEHSDGYAVLGASGGVGWRVGFVGSDSVERAARCGSLGRAKARPYIFA